MLIIREPRTSPPICCWIWPTKRYICAGSLLTEGDIARGQLPDLTTVIDCPGWSRLPGTDVEVRALTDKPFVRCRSARVPQDWTAR